MSSNGRRHCVVPDVVLEEESLDNKEIEDGNLTEYKPPQGTAPLDSPERKAPSEHVEQGSASSFPADTDQSVVMPDQEWRSRTQSDGSRCKRPEGYPKRDHLGLATANSDIVYPALISNDRKSLNNQTGLSKLIIADNKNVLTAGVSMPQNCTFKNSTPEVVPKQVECPF